MNYLRMAATRAHSIKIRAKILLDLSPHWTREEALEVSRFLEDQCGTITG